MKLKRLTADNETFRTLEFKDGFNVVIAERTEDATSKDSRNGVGKSTLIDIIHFCLGGSKSKRLRADELKGWTFSLDITLNGRDITVRRNTTSMSRVVIIGDTSGWQNRPVVEKTGQEPSLKKAEWNDELGRQCFTLDETCTGDYCPTFRNLFAYFSRRGRDAYASPFEMFRKQKTVQTQVYNAFLLGLDWRYAQALQQLKEREVILNALKAAADTGIVSEVIGSMGELEALLVRLEEQAKTTSEALESFRVHPQYKGLEENADTLTRNIHKNQNSSNTERRLLSHYQEAVSQESPDSSNHLIELYEKAGIYLGDVVTKRLSDVEQFHNQVIANRREFLESEITRLTDSLVTRQTAIDAAINERAGLFAVLQTHGALEEHALLQQQHLGLVAQVSDTERRIQCLRDFERGVSELKIEREQLQQSARLDLLERQERVKAAISKFNANSESLYQAPGKLLIDITDAGYQFSVDILCSDSDGVGNMKVFCYDLLLAQTWAENMKSPGLVIHDSLLFDGVDERQYAAALELAATECERIGVQYICTLNSDTLPTNDFSSTFDINSYVRLRLTDSSNEGALLGVRF